MPSCLVCEKEWVSGSVLIDGSVYHDACYSNLVTSADALASQCTAVRAALVQPLTWKENIGIFLSPARGQEILRRKQSLRSQLTDLETRLTAVRKGLTILHDLWPTYPPDWSERREQVQLRDGYACNECGVGNRLHLHHKRAIRAGGTHKIENLALLCEWCHSAEHGGQKFRYRTDEGESAVKLRILSINGAIASGKDVRFRYVNAKGVRTERKVSPYELRKLTVSELQKLTGQKTISKEGRLCLFGFCHLRSADRTFAIDRITHLEIV